VQKVNCEAVLNLAAKLGKDKGDQRWLPLWVHSADTCGVVSYLLREWLPETARKAMCRNLSEEQLISAGRCAAVLHDLGKASILFQTRITEELNPLREKLKAIGLKVLSDDDAVYFSSSAARVAHATAGEILLLRAGCQLSFAEIIGAHHGKPWAEGRELYLEDGCGLFSKDPRSVAIWGRKENRPVWQKAQEECLRWMLESVNCPDLASLPDIPQTTAVLLTGLVIMADWIASNENYFPLIPLGQTDPGALDERLARGLKELDLPPPWKPVAGKDLDHLSKAQFGFAPNTVQRAMAEAARTSDVPGLMILEATMGLG